MFDPRSYRERDYHRQSDSNSSHHRENRSPASSQASESRRCHSHRTPANTDGRVIDLTSPDSKYGGHATPPQAPSPRCREAETPDTNPTNPPGRLDHTPGAQAHTLRHRGNEEESSPSVGPGPAYPYYPNARCPAPGVGEGNASPTPSAGPGPAYPYYLDARSPSPAPRQVRNTRSPCEDPAIPPPAHLHPGRRLVRRQSREENHITHLDGLLRQARAQYNHALASANYHEQMDAMTLLRERREDREAGPRRAERVREKRWRMDDGELCPPGETAIDGLTTMGSKEDPQIYWHNGRTHLSSFL